MSDHATFREKMIERFAANWARVRHTIRNYFILVFLLALLLFAAFFNRIVIFVHPGEEGVIWKPFFGGTQTDRIYKEGLQLLWPWNKLYIYNVRIQQIAHDFDALSKNGLPIHFEVSIRYQPIRETLPVLHQEIGPDYVEKVVKPEVQAHVRKVVANYLPEEIYTSEGYLLQIIRQGAMAALDERNISLDDLLIKRMALPEAIRNAIERKLSSEQLSLQYDYILIKERKEAERKRIEAMGIRDFQRISGEGGMFGQYLNFYGIEATLELAKSPNSKTLLIGNRDNGLPLLFNLPASDPAPGASLPKETDINTLLSKETKDLLEEKRLPEASTKPEVQDGER
ncbi:MAG: prohibitin family protein [Opitutaceae bacterium]|nr:prohibitin family protein [Opitutaceae bacterium]